MFHTKSKIYAIADQETCLKNGIGVLDFVKAVIAAGVEVIQYRDKISSLETIDKMFYSMVRFADSKITLIINDYPEIATRYNAMLHLGQTDTQAGSTQPFGRSTHSIVEVEQAMNEIPQPEYVGFGAMFLSPTKPDVASNRGVLGGVLKIWKKDIVLIGGITLENLPRLPAEDRIYYAIISDFFANGNRPSEVEKRACRYGNP